MQLIDPLPLLCICLDLRYLFHCTADEGTPQSFDMYDISI